MRLTLEHTEDLFSAKGAPDGASCLSSFLYNTNSMSNTVRGRNSDDRWNLPSSGLKSGLKRAWLTCRRPKIHRGQCHGGGERGSRRRCDKREPGGLKEGTTEEQGTKSRDDSPPKEPEMEQAMLAGRKGGTGSNLERTGHEREWESVKAENVGQKKQGKRMESGDGDRQQCRMQRTLGNRRLDIHSWPEDRHFAQPRMVDEMAIRRKHVQPLKPN